MRFDTEEQYDRWNHSEIMTAINARNAYSKWQRNALITNHNDMYGIGMACRFCAAAAFDNIAAIFDRPAKTAEEINATPKLVTKKLTR